MEKRRPDFENMQKLLRREKTGRPVLFELFLNSDVYRMANGGADDPRDPAEHILYLANAFKNLGYDYATVYASAMTFPTGAIEREESISLNDGNIITDEASFEAYHWPDPDAFDDSALEKVKDRLPEGMKLMAMGPGGVLENVISLVGYDNLCFMIYEEPELAQRIFDEVGSRLVKYYIRAAQHESVGFICSNDDWGFNTQTFLSPQQMRQYVFPWHKKIVEVAHNAGLPIMLHSCGYMKDVIGDIIDMGYDAKHSYEDNIMPIEEAYEAWHDKIVLLGGIDMNFICTQPPEAVKARTRAMLERAEGRTPWAVGTGNSVARYVPVEQYLAMIEEAIGYNPMA